MTISGGDLLTIVGILLGSGAFLAAMRWVGKHAVKDVMSDPLRDIKMSIDTVSVKADEAKALSQEAVHEAQSTRAELREHMKKEEADIAVDHAERKERQAEMNIAIKELRENQTRTHQRLDLVLQGQSLQPTRRRLFR